MATCRSICQQGSRNMCSTISPRNPPRTTSLKTTKITEHQSVRGQGGIITVMYETQWTGPSTPSWEREMDFQLFRYEILRYWAGTPHQHRQTNRLYRRMRIGAAQRELSRSNGERFLAPGYGCLPQAERFSRYSATALPNGVHFWYTGDDGLWWLGKISSSKGWGIFGALFE